MEGKDWGCLLKRRLKEKRRSRSRSQSRSRSLSFQRWRSCSRSKLVQMQHHTSERQSSQEESPSAEVSPSPQEVKEAWRSRSRSQSCSRSQCFQMQRSRLRSRIIRWLCTVPETELLEEKTPSAVDFPLPQDVKEDEISHSSHSRARTSSSPYFLRRRRSSLRSRYRGMQQISAKAKSSVMEKSGDMVKLGQIKKILPDEESAFLIKCKNLYMCPKCKKLFKLYKGALNHYMKCTLKLRRMKVHYKDVIWICLYCRYQCNNLIDLTLNKKMCRKSFIIESIEDLLNNYAQYCRYSCATCSFASITRTVFEKHSCKKEFERMKSCYINIRKFERDVANYEFHNRQECNSLDASDNAKKRMEPISNMSPSQSPACATSDLQNFLMETLFYYLSTYEKSEANKKCNLCNASFFNQVAFEKHCIKHKSNKMPPSTVATAEVMPRTVLSGNVDQSSTSATSDLQNFLMETLFYYLSAYQKSEANKKCNLCNA